MLMNRTKAKECRGCRRWRRRLLPILLHMPWHSWAKHHQDEYRRCVQKCGEH